MSWRIGRIIDAYQPHGVIGIEHAADLEPGDCIAYPQDSGEFNRHFVVTYLEITEDVYLTIVNRRIPPDYQITMTFNKVLWVIDVEIDKELVTAVYQHDSKYFVVRID